MNLNLTDVLLEEGTRLEKEVPVDLDAFAYTFGTFPIRKKSPLKVSVYQDSRKALRIHGETDLTVEIPCDRCLDPVEVPLELRFDERVSRDVTESAEEQGEDEAPEAEAFEWDYLIQGYNLDVDKLISGEALLNWPSRVLCREDCKGLCPVCGRNLNLGECGCDRRQLDPRMATVLDVFSRVDKEV